MIEDLCNSASRNNESLSKYLTLLLRYLSENSNSKIDSYRYDIVVKENNGYYEYVYSFLSSKNLNISSFIRSIVDGIKHYNRSNNTNYQVNVVVNFQRKYTVKLDTRCDYNTC